VTDLLFQPTLRVAAKTDYNALVNLVRVANGEVALQLGLTEENASGHTSFFTKQRLIKDINKGNEFFVLEHTVESTNELVGCVSMRKADKQVWYMNRLSTLPAYQNNGIGTALVQHCIKLVKQNEGVLLRIGIIEEHESLKQWYVKLGFELGAVKQFNHLPFNVRYMSFHIR
jgi:N-acetylglutamate synthase-like GNAT family acetyltransferase